MSKFNDAYLTDAGAKLLTRSIAEDFKIEFVKMIVGDGIYSDQDKTKEKIVKMSELKSKRQECGFSYIGITGNDTAMLKAVIENADVDEGYRITEIGIVAKKSGDATSNGILYSLAVAEEADFLPPKTTPISYIQEYYTKIHNSESVTINVEMGAYATAEDLDKVMYPKYDTAESLEALTSGERLEKAFGKIKKAIDIFIDHIALKASKTVLGHVKVSDSETVTDNTGLALAATEKNEGISGTIASKVRALDERLTNHKSSTDHDERYYTEAEVNNLLDGKSDNSHTHDGRYYTEAEVNNLVNGRIPVYASCNRNWIWNGLGGQPQWVWGGDDGTNMYVYNPSNFSVNYANSANTANSATVSDRSNWVKNSNDAGYMVGIGQGTAFSGFYAAGGSALNGVLSLGSSGGRWKQLYVSSSSISTSDKNMKENIIPLTDKHIALFQKLVPVSFAFKDGTSGRTHIGFISQDVEAAMSELGMSSLDFAGFCKDELVESYLDDEGNQVDKPIFDENGDPKYIYSLRYEEFIALNTHVIQRLWDRMDQFQKELAEIRAHVFKV